MSSSASGNTKTTAAKPPRYTRVSSVASDQSQLSLIPDDDDAGLPFDEFRPSRESTWLNSRISYYRYRANKLLLHPAYILFIALLFFLQIALFIWGLVHHEFFTNSTKAHPTAYIVLDIVVVVLLIIELGIRVLAHQKFFHSVMNVIDVLVMAVVIVALALYTVNPDDVVLATALQSFRSAVQLVRVIIILKHHKERRQFLLNAEGNIDFNQFVSTVTSPQHSTTASVYDNDHRIDITPASLPYATHQPLSFIDSGSFTHVLPHPALAHEQDDETHEHSLTASSRVHHVEQNPVNAVHHKASNDDNDSSNTSHGLIDEQNDDAADVVFRPVDMNALEEKQPIASDQTRFTSVAVT